MTARGFTACPVPVTAAAAAASNCSLAIVVSEQHRRCAPLGAFFLTICTPPGASWEVLAPMTRGAPPADGDRECNWRPVRAAPLTEPPETPALRRAKGTMAGPSDTSDVRDRWNCCQSKPSSGAPRLLASFSRRTRRVSPLEQCECDRSKVETPEEALGKVVNAAPEPVGESVPGGVRELSGS